MIQYASLTITKASNVTFTIDAVELRNGTEVPLPQYGSSEYTGTFMGNYLYIKTGTGAIAYLQVPYDVITYVDEVGGGTDTYDSAFQAHDSLKQAGFFVYSTNGGGSGSAGKFVDLTDVNVPSLVGRQGQVVRVNETGTALETAMIGTADKFVNLLDWGGGALQPNKYLATNSLGNAVVQLDIDTIENTPIPAGFFRLKAKGYIWDGSDYIFNQEEFANEAGDFYEGFALGDDGYMYYYPTTRWDGAGDVQDIANHVYAKKELIPLTGEPQP